MVVMSWAKVLPVKMEKSGWIRKKFRVPCISRWKEKGKISQRRNVLVPEGKTKASDGNWRQADFHTL